MALLLNIDTATEVASVCVSRNGSCIAYRESKHQKEHAAFIHTAIEIVLEEANVRLPEIEAFAVTSGPGSYTGLRVGMANTKGFCYAFSKPLITVNTLEVMSKAALDILVEIGETDILCPMIDARRMEVFTALYDQQLNNLLAPQPFIIEENSFEGAAENGEIMFFGSGSVKFKNITALKRARFLEVNSNAKSLAELAEKAFQLANFADVSYSEPNYFKDFQSNYKR
ncbi:MAG: tRNA (adenosine(37)-N6)-threonylcarbamoyltransferase complex dimerization subunit type 1 TsaB [Bacteroidota bacterium]|nr:tRNA (adenosine(37)-N6)-threonylcarbamoyltransferase complex dimerization subunit type 1 TsaB [Bacteroidota bacterium]